MDGSVVKTALLTAIVFIFSSAAQAACKDLTMADLPRIARERGSPLELVFFATWCSACKEHLTKKHGTNALFVGSFDKRERIEAVAEALKLQGPCFFDQGVSEALGVVSLPRTITWSPAQ